MVVGVDESRCLTVPDPGARRLAAVMFTDMVGYTALFQSDERDAVAQRSTFVTAVESAHTSFGGSIVARLGDGTMSTFESAATAVEAAVSLQRELQAAGVQVRIGLHAGEVIDDGATIIGDAVNVASRIESFAVPGGVMVSESVRDLLRNRPDVVLGSLGAFKLKNVGRPMELFAVVADGIVVPAPSALEGKGERYASLPTNLPEAAGPLVGRAEELDALVELVLAHRIVTVTGPGGVGKTRLLAEVGRRLLSEFLDGVAFVSLADVSDPTDLLATLAEALDVKEAEGRSTLDGVSALIGTKRALLLLDNFEQLVDAAPDVGSLVASCPHLRVVVSSRTPLRLAAEVEHPVAPLALPPSLEGISVGSLLGYAAVALFVERARTATGTLQLTSKNAATIGAICQRLDGLPLALELAAARLRLLTPEALLERLGHALDVLTAGRRDSPARQKTLRATIDWSHSLLSEPEQRLFRRMSVFAGGSTIDALEDVCGDAATPCLEGLESLVEKALVQVAAGGARYTMLQTIAEYAAERLDDFGERDDVAMRHAHHFAKVAREVRVGLELDQQVAALERGMAEEQNLQSALDTLLGAAREGDQRAADAGLQICADLHFYWHIRGKNVTAREISTAFLAAGSDDPPTGARAGAMRTAALGAWALGQFETANAEWDVAHEVAVAAGDELEQCLCAMFSAVGLIGFDQDAGMAKARDAVAAAERLSYPFGEEMGLTALGILHRVSGDVARAKELFAAALAIQERIGDHEGAGLSLGGLAEIAASDGSSDVALGLYDSSLASFETIGDRAEEARILSEIAQVHLDRAELAAARARYLDSVRAYGDVGSVRGVGLSLLGLAAVVSLGGRRQGGRDDRRGRRALRPRGGHRQRLLGRRARSRAG